jgi:5-methyltetrahydropteroyltriglutamate--homocysteine methyltransferase
MSARIRTTHVGSLPRPQDVVEVVWAEDRGDPVDALEYDRVITEAIAEGVRNQARAGVDFVSDGEMGKIGYATYIRHRLAGFEIGEAPRATPADLDAFPRYRDRLAGEAGTPKYLRPICRGPIAYEHPDRLHHDIRRLRAGLEGQSVQGAFMNAPSPGVIAVFHPNEHYGSFGDYLDALSDAMQIEYEAIVSAGLQLQIDAPDLAMGRHIMYRERTEKEFLDFAHRHVEAINRALRNIPADRVRLHLCWGNYEGPHHFDIELEKIVDIVLSATPQTLLFEAANPRHAHEWAVWRETRIPEEKILAPGVIDSTSNYIEHPRLIAQRLSNFIDIVGTERVLASSDCGFGTWAGFGAVDPDICWAKLRALSEGAAIASGSSTTASVQK